jgi:beta-hydroxylase
VEVVQQLLAPKFFILYALVLCAVYIHFRGKVRHTFLRQLTDHSTFMAPYNVLMYVFSGVPNTPFIEVERFPELERLRDNWEIIRDEAAALYDTGHVKASKKYDDMGFNSFFRSGWKRFYLKWYDDFLPSAQELCPKTVALLRETPSISAAAFTMMAPRSRLVTHRDPFAGSLRYHLGLITPNSEDCRIAVDGTPYVWRDGEDVVFDETFIHSPENDTDEKRIILFCDVVRPLRFRPIAALNRFVSTHFIKGTATKNEEGDKVGFLNRAFGTVYRTRLVGKKLKEKSRFVYYALKWILILGGLYLIFFRTLIG